MTRTVCSDSEIDRIAREISGFDAIQRSIDQPKFEAAFRQLREAIADWDWFEISELASTLRNGSKE